MAVFATPSSKWDCQPIYGVTPNRSALTPEERLRFSWEHFCRVIKFQRRYFFSTQRKRKDDEIYSPGQILQIIFSYAENEGAFAPSAEWTAAYSAPGINPKGKPTIRPVHWGRRRWSMRSRLTG